MATTRASHVFSTGSYKGRMTGKAGKRWERMTMIAGSKEMAPMAHARGRSVEKTLPKSWAIRGGKKPFATSGFFRRTWPLRGDLASFYLESNCMEFLLKSADNVTGSLPSQVKIDVREDTSKKSPNKRTEYISNQCGRKSAGFENHFSNRESTIGLV